MGWKLWITGILLAVLPIIQGQGNHVITPLRNNPGLYYEHLHDVRLTHVDWKVTIFIDLDKLAGGLPTLEKYVEIASSNCDEDPTGECGTAIRPEYLRAEMKRARDALASLKRVSQRISISKEDFDGGRNFKKRSAPFGFIGSISQSLFGTLTTDDAVYFNTEIDKLYKDQRKMAHLVASQTHLVQSDLDKIHEEMKSLFNQNTQLYTAFRRASQFGHKMAEDIEKLRSSYVFARWAHNLETTINTFIESTRILTAAIHAARRGDIHPELLTEEQLTNISMEIQKVNKDYDFPLPSNDLRLEELAAISRVRVGYSQGRIVLVIHVPLLNRDHFHLYKMHPCTTPQQLSGEINGSAYIIPKDPYLALSIGHERYFTASEAYVSSCHATRRHHICTMEEPVHTVSAGAACECMLLIQPSTEVLKTCDVRVSPTHEAYWKRVPTLGGWLFSVSKPEMLQILCAGQKDELVELKGAGILQLSPGCTARTAGTHLYGMETRKGSDQYFNAPEVILNITELVPGISKHAVLAQPSFKPGDCNALLPLICFILQDFLVLCSFGHYNDGYSYSWAPIGHTTYNFKII